MLHPFLAALAAANTWKRSPPERVIVSQILDIGFGFLAAQRAELIVPDRPEEMWIERISLPFSASFL